MMFLCRLVISAFESFLESELFVTLELTVKILFLVLRLGCCLESCV